MPLKRDWMTHVLILVMLFLACSAALVPCSAGQGTSPWRGEYFDNPDLLGAPTLERNDRAIDFEWQDGPPDYSLPADGFSARWTAYLFFEAGTYTFETHADGGVRLWVDAQLAIPQWEASAAALYAQQVELIAGYHIVRMEYRHLSGDAVAQLRWRGQLGETGSNGVEYSDQSAPTETAPATVGLTTTPVSLEPFDPNAVRRRGGPNESWYEWSQGYKGRIFYDVGEDCPHDGS